MQHVLALTGAFLHQGTQKSVAEYQVPLLAWLSEQHERQEFRYTWTTTMEILITLFVGFEVLVDVLKLSQVLPTGF
jgi:hypothetical protein